MSTFSSEQSSPYLSIDQLIDLIDEPQANGCRAILARYATRIHRAQGASHNHQAWPGGYLDHICEAMNLAVALYPSLTALRPLPFSLSDALLVLFVHDLEKPWRDATQKPGEISPPEIKLNLDSHEGRQEFRLALIRQHGIQLNPEQENAVDFIEGEGRRYSRVERRMGRLASFCHACDTLSARLWHDHPRMEKDEWSPPRGRSA